MLIALDGALKVAQGVTCEVLIAVASCGERGASGGGEQVQASQGKASDWSGNETEAIGSQIEMDTDTLREPVLINRRFCLS